MVLNIVLLIVGMILLVKGADLFVGGSSRIAKAMKIPPLVIGLTLVSMGTSAPEASVSMIGAVNGMNDLSVGNVVGSNIFNTLFILGVSGAIIPLAVGRDARRFDIPAMLAVYAALLIFAFVITPLRIDIYESVALIVAFAAYTAFLIVRAVRSDRSVAIKAPPAESAQNAASGAAQAQTDSTTDGTTLSAPPTIELVPAPNSAAGVDRLEPAARKKRNIPLWLSVILTAVGLAGVIFGGDLVVDSASAIAKAAGMSETLVGLTIVAVGTSLPELVTSVVAAIKKESDIAVGNIIGSNIFNIAFILGLSSAISAPVLNYSSLTDMLVMLGSGILIFAAAVFIKSVARWQGIAMAAMYVGYLAYIIVRN